MRWKNQFELADNLLKMGLDPVIEIWLPKPSYPEVRVRTWRGTEPDERYPLLYKEYETPKGTLRQVVRETEDWYSPVHDPTYWNPVGPRIRETNGVELIDDWNTPRYKEPLIRGWKDLEKLRYILKAPTGNALSRWKEQCREVKKQAQKRNVLLWAYGTYAGDAAFWFCKPEDFLYSLTDDPDFVQEFLRIVHEWQMNLVELVLDMGVDVLVRRAYYEIPEFWSPRFYRKFLVPLIEEETKYVHEAGTKECYVLTKGMMQYVDIFKQVDIDINWGVDPVLGGADLVTLKQELGEKICFWGGISGEVTIPQGTTKEIREAVREAIRILAPGGGFVLMPVWAIENMGTPWKNVETLIDAWREFGTYPIRV